MSGPDDLAPDPSRVLGPADAAVTLVEFGDFGCPHCAAARLAVEGLVRRLGRVRLAWRHFPDPELHPGADLAAEAAQAAAAAGRFWPMHEALLAHQGAFDAPGLTRLAAELGLDVAEFGSSLSRHRYRADVERDVAIGRDRGVTGTPTFFIGEERANAHWTELRSLLPQALEASPGG